MQRQQHWTRRQHDRLEVFECAVLYRNIEDEPIRAMIVDIGLGGLQIRAKEPLRIGESLLVKIGRDQGTPLVVRGEIRHTQYIVESGLHAAGLKFAPETHDERLMVAKYLNSTIQSRNDIA